MKAQDIFIAHPDSSEQAQAIRAFFKALKVKFEVAKEDTYNPEFVDKILQGKKDIEQGNFTEVKKENLKSFIDSL